MRAPLCTVNLLRTVELCLFEVRLRKQSLACINPSLKFRISTVQ